MIVGRGSACKNSLQSIPRQPPLQIPALFRPFTWNINLSACTASSPLPLLHFYPRQTCVPHVKCAHTNVSLSTMTYISLANVFFNVSVKYEFAYNATGKCELKIFEWSMGRDEDVNLHKISKYRVKLSNGMPRWLWISGYVWKGIVPSFFF